MKRRAVEQNEWPTCTSLSAWALLCSLIFCLGSLDAAEAEPEYDFQGTLSTTYFTSVQQSQSARAQAGARLNENHSAVLFAEFLNYGYLDEAFTQTEWNQFILREGFYQYYHSGFELRFGQQIIPWGKADGINPTDFLTGRDFQRFTPDAELRRIGAPGFAVNWTPAEGSAPYSFTAIWNFDFAKSTLLLPPGSLPPNTRVSDPVTTAQDLARSEFALKANYFGSSWDVSASAYSGWNHNPEFATGSFGADAILTIEPRFRRIQALGADFSKSLGSYVFRAEGAHIWSSASELASPGLPSHFSVVAGLEKPFLEKARLQVQALSTYYTDRRSPDEATGANPAEVQINRGLSQANAILYGYRNDLRWGGTVRVSYGDSESDFVPELLFVGYAETRELLIRPKFLYRWTQSFQTDVGAEFYTGPEGSAFHLYDQFNSFLIEARYIF